MLTDLPWLIKHYLANFHYRIANIHSPINHVSFIAFPISRYTSHYQQANKTLYWRSSREHPDWAAGCPTGIELIDTPVVRSTWSHCPGLECRTSLVTY